MLLCRTDQHLHGNLPSVTAAKGGHTRYWKQRFTYFCNAQICNTGSFFSINKWERKCFSFTCLIRFSLSTFRTYMKIWWCFGSYLCRKIENSKGFTNFQAALYIYTAYCIGHMSFWNISFLSPTSGTLGTELNIYLWSMALTNGLVPPTAILAPTITAFVPIYLSTTTLKWREGEVQI